MRISLTADLHFGLSENGDRATRELAKSLAQEPPDVLVFAGDTAVGRQLDPCFRIFENIPCQKLFTAGNHDLWVDKSDFDSLEMYSFELAAIAEKRGFKFLDDEPWVAPDRSVAIVGTVNWYDYSFAPSALLEAHPDHAELFAKKYVPNGVYNDVRFVKLGMTDIEFTGMLLARIEEQLRDVSKRADTIVLVSHHPSFPELLRPLGDPPQEKELFRRVYGGNRGLSDMIPKFQKVRFAFCGHTHRYREAEVAGVRAVNIGSDYDRKNLIHLDMPAGRVEVREFS